MVCVMGAKKWAVAPLSRLSLKPSLFVYLDVAGDGDIYCLGMFSPELGSYTNGDA